MTERIPPRGMSAADAARYCSLSAKTLARYGPPPTVVGGRKIYDRKLLDMWLDRLAGIAAPSGGESKLQAAVNARRKSQVRNVA